MAQCSNCKAESMRVRSRWDRHGKQLSDECPECSPASFEKYQDPSDKKIWMGYEAHPNEYQKLYDSQGVIFERKPEYRAEQEHQMMQPTAEEAEKQARAVAEKRAHRRTERMTPAEERAAMARAEEVARWVQMSVAQGRDVN